MLDLIHKNNCIKALVASNRQSSALSFICFKQHQFVRFVVTV